MVLYLTQACSLDSNRHPLQEFIMFSRLVSVLFLMLSAGCTVMIPPLPKFGSVGTVQVQTVPYGNARRACMLPRLQQCWLVNETVPDGESSIAPPLPVTMYPGQWAVFDKNGVPAFYALVPNVTGFVIVFQPSPVIPFVPGPRPCTWCRR